MRELDPIEGKQPMGEVREVETPERVNSQEVEVSLQPFRSCRLPKGLYCFQGGVIGAEETAPFVLSGCCKEG
ncbi:hypothetical protein MELA_00295 [Candidatus Methylomirabilis lanthanidiphila]|uniref:Uncharacterized protein n=1 Tax=Candidatus Methylomirabilis lanthanidiphila TaxID=2211376 RepID=A0A564ZFM5_9BACT|nr:hypothetical protein MELA_00295 [Candidatus Methylomirabilis lanthanidiphila]